MTPQPSLNAPLPEAFIEVSVFAPMMSTIPQGFPKVP
jgi:hypothetical protein